MIQKAKTTLSAVASFHDAIESVRDYSSRFQKGRACLTDAINDIGEQLCQVRREHDSLQSAIHRLGNTISVIENHLRDLREELSETPRTTTVNLSENVECKVPNPDYLRLKAEIAEQQIKLNHAHVVRTECKTHIVKMQNAVKTLEHNRNKCRSIRDALAELQAANLRSGNHACSCTERARQAIIHYQTATVKFTEQNSPNYRKANYSVDELVGITVQTSVHIDITVQTADLKGEPDVDAKPEETYTDDNGTVFRKGNQMLPNTTYQRNGYTYQTDSLGRVISTGGKLTLNVHGQTNRNMKDSLDIIGKGNQKETDDRGHLVGHQFNGADSLENMVPQDCKINRGEYRRLEDYLAFQVKQGKAVTVSIIPMYSQDSYRPHGIFYFYNIDGKENTRLFPNQSQEETHD